MSQDLAGMAEAARAGHARLVEAAKVAALAVRHGPDEAWPPSIERVAHKFGFDLATPYGRTAAKMFVDSLRPATFPEVATFHFERI